MNCKQLSIPLPKLEDLLNRQEDLLELVKDYDARTNSLRAHLTMAAGPVLSCIPRFTGEGDCKTFLTRFSAVAKAQKWEDETKIGYFTALLGDGPCQWLQSLAPTKTATFDLIQKEFVDRYGPTDYALKKSFSDCKQTATQSIMDYIEQVRALGRKLKKTDEDIFDRISVGLHPSIAENIMSHEPKDITDLERIAQLRANFAHATPAGDVSSLIADFKQELKQDIAKLWDNVQHQVQALSVPSEAPRARPIVYYQIYGSHTAPATSIPSPMGPFSNRSATGYLRLSTS